MRLAIRLAHKNQENIMTKYLLTFHGAGMAEFPDDPAEVEKLMGAWGAWYGSMGDALVDGGAPVSGSSAIGPDGSATESPAGLTGYTIIDVTDEAAATKIAQGCPVLEGGSSVQISALIEM